MTRISLWFRHATEAVAALMLAALFATFVVQIFSRYMLASPFGWTLELCLALWIWIVFWGNAFVVRDRDHVTFDILYTSVPRGIQRVFALVSAGAIIVGLGWSLLPTWDWIDFLKIKKSATLKLPMRDIYAIYALFLVVVVLRYGWRFVQVLRHGPPAEAPEIHAGEQG